MNSFTKTTCVSCKVYFGSEERMGMCSVCFKDYNKKETSKSEEAASATTTTVNTATTALPTSIPNISPEISTEINTMITSTEDVKMEEPITNVTKPVQKNPMACWICNKKVGYMGFKCKCDFIFCGTHRHFSDHNCEFDYKTYDRKKLVDKSNFGGATDNKSIK